MFTITNASVTVGRTIKPAEYEGIKVERTYTAVVTDGGHVALAAQAEQDVHDQLAAILARPHPLSGKITQPVVPPQPAKVALGTPAASVPTLGVNVIPLSPAAPTPAPSATLITGTAPAAATPDPNAALTDQGLATYLSQVVQAHKGIAEKITALMQAEYAPRISGIPMDKRAEFKAKVDALVAAAAPAAQTAAIPL
jgi:hypothetical protein